MEFLFLIQRATLPHEEGVYGANGSSCYWSDPASKRWSHSFLAGCRSMSAGGAAHRSAAPMGPSADSPKPQKPWKPSAVGGNWSARRKPRLHSERPQAGFAPSTNLLRGSSANRSTTVPPELHLISNIFNIYLHSSKMGDFRFHHYSIQYLYFYSSKNLGHFTILHMIIYRDLRNEICTVYLYLHETQSLMWNVWIFVFQRFLQKEKKMDLERF